MKSKALLLIIVVIFGCFLMFSCSKDREYDEGEVIAAAENLIKKSELLNDIYYGHGIEYLKDESTSNGSYYEADYLSLKKFGVETVDDIVALTRSCYTTDLSNSIINTKLSSVSDEDGIQGYARYYQKYSAIDDTPESIMVYKDAVVYLTDTVVYDYNSIAVSRVKGDEVFVKITVMVTSEDKKTQTRDIEISLLEESDGWRINSPTYVKYIDQDYYDDLQKN